MKTTRLSFFALTTLVLFVTGCSKEAQPETPAQIKQSKPEVAGFDKNSLSGRGATSGTCNPAAYNIVLESRTLVNGNWEWVWSVQNSNPGNGNNGTVQNLSHWGMQFGSCFNWSSVVSAAYSSNGYNWTGFTPVFQSDPSQSCMTAPVFKFDYGTIGSSKSYYKLVMNQAYEPSIVPGYYKSGANTGCCTFTFTGIGCSGILPPDER